METSPISPSLSPEINKLNDLINHNHDTEGSSSDNTNNEENSQRLHV